MKILSVAFGALVGLIAGLGLACLAFMVPVMLGFISWERLEELRQSASPFTNNLIVVGPAVVGMLIGGWRFWADTQPHPALKARR